jgi:hypothetical protein
VKLRYNRNPIIGDKFSSRHGQKGTLSLLYRDIDMPYCANTGIRPDVIINPHAFPSRMTIGMLVESLASKGAAAEGHFVDATPFKHAGKESGAGDDHVATLVKNGFSRYGSEVSLLLPPAIRPGASSLDGLCLFLQARFFTLCLLSTSISSSGRQLTYPLTATLLPLTRQWSS